MICRRPQTRRNETRGTATEIYSTKAVAALAGVSYRTLEDWVLDGLLSPERLPTRGTGVLAWREADVVAAQRIAREKAHAQARHFGTRAERRAAALPPPKGGGGS